MVGPESEGALFDAYLEALLTGRVEAPDSFAARHDRTLDGPPEWMRGVYELVACPSDSTGGAAPELAADADLPFDTLGEYRLLRTLGEGGMGRVFLAQQKSLGRLVAVKIIRPELAGSPTAIARFDREARVVAKLRHPHINTLLGVGVERSVNYLVMEFVAGRSLADVLHDRRDAHERAPLTDILRWSREIAEALAYAHREGVVHRDVKPSNIRITPEGHAVLMDFGLARQVGSGSLSLTAGFAGSPVYAAPEQFGDEDGTVDGRTDVYSLGVTLYEGLTGAVPFEDGSFERVMRRVLTEDVPRPMRKGLHLPPDLEVVLLKSIEKDPARRYGSAQAFAVDLDAVLMLRPIQARPDGLLRRVARWARQNRAASAAIAVALGALGVFYFADARSERMARLADRGRAEGLIDRARDALARYGGLRDGYEEALWRRKALDIQVNARWLNPAERRERFEAARITKTHERDRLLLFEDALDGLSRAADLDPNAPGLREAWAMYYYERWFDVRDELDPRLAEWFRAKVEEHDSSDGTWSERVAGRASLRIRSQPAGARVRLYRYQSEDLLGGDEPRYVAVPAAVRQAEPPPGTWALRVVGREDCIVQVAGHQIENVVLVRGRDAAVGGFERLVAIDGEPVRDVVEARTRGALGDVSRHFAFAGPNHERQEVVAASLDDLGLACFSPRAAVASGGVDVTIWRAGVAEREWLENGMETRASASPLFVSPAATVGTTPLEETFQDPGWYVALLSLEGYESLRLSFHVDHSCEHYSKGLDLRGVLSQDGTSPPGFVRVTPPPPHPVFWIQEHEVTCAAFAEFLDDPKTRLAMESERDAGGRALQAGMLARGWSRGADGRILLPAGARDLPVLSVSWVEAAAYAAWFDERHWVGEGRWGASLPTVLEWRFAGWGGDSRDYAFGESFSPAWAKSRYSRSLTGVEPVLSYPVDESPYGVYDLTGSAAEWALDRAQNGSDERAVMGGAWDRSEPHSFAISATRWLAENERDASTGLRLVLRPTR
ncbi:MAG: protein kinase [bacterium]|nr:protein kinase [bacterium]